MFQTENYEGGFDGAEKEFVFSFYDYNEYWFQMSLQQVKEISSGQLISVLGIQSDYYDEWQKRLHTLGFEQVWPDGSTIISSA